MLGLGLALSHVSNRNPSPKDGEEGVGVGGYESALAPISDTWIENCIVSTDERNGRNITQLSKRKYIKKYGSSKKNSKMKNKHG